MLFQHRPGNLYAKQVPQSEICSHFCCQGSQSCFEPARIEEMSASDLGDLTADGDDLESDSEKVRSESQGTASENEQVAADEEVEAGAKQPAGKAKAKAKGKAKQKAAAKVTGKRKASAKRPEDAALDEWKKCTDCKRFKLAATDFNQDQSKCKPCNNNRRGFGRLCGSQQASDTVAKLQDSDPKQHAALYKAYCKDHEMKDKEAGKQKFSIMGFMQEWKSSEGVRKEGVWEMMWEAEFLEWAKSAKGGFITGSEARAQWQQFLDDPELDKDDDGPRGYKRCAIKVKDIIKQYEDVGRSQIASREGKLGKNATEEDFAKKLLLCSEAFESPPVLTWVDSRTS